MQLKKSKGKFAPLTITKDTQLKIKSFKDRLKQMIENEEINEIYKNKVCQVLNGLDTYDLNLLIAYYEYDCKASEVARLLGVNTSVIYSRIKDILKKCKSSI